MNPFCGGFMLLLTALTQANDIPGDPIAFFETNIRPILFDNCYQCHSTRAEKIQGGLLLDSRWGWETGGDSGPAILPGDADKSLLIDAVRGTENVVGAMPPKAKLSHRQIALLESWVKMGAPDPRSRVEKNSGSPVEAFDLAKRFNEHWSWRPIADPEAPTVQDVAWPRSDLDRFILARIEARGLKPALEADRRTWLRRVTFDLTGLPPSPQETTTFLHDKSPGSYEKVVQGLLDSPHFGEKWARHWMDLVRYAETCGHEFDYPIPHAYQYRDYLIRAFNVDLPYDDFVREHIAGDLLPNPRRHPDQAFNESVIGTGFWYLHEATHAPTDVLADEADHMDNQLDVFGKAFLGLTVACARCHDHKFDAISTKDYYALTGYIHGSSRTEVPIDRGRTLEKTADAQRSLRSRAAPLLHHLAGDRPGVHFLAAIDLVRKGQAENLETISAAAQGLNPTLIATWCDLFAAEANDLRTAEGFWAQWFRDPAIVAELRPRVEETASALERFRAMTRLYEDFAGDALPPGWSTTGVAFQPSGSHPGVGFQAGRPLSEPGVMDSALFGGNHVGTLRSPTFEISSPKIFVRVRSKDVLMRVVMDNYIMSTYNALLFRGTFRMKKDADTQGQWRWIAFDGDLVKYIGHKAYLEFRDSGGAWVAVDEIRFSDGVKPPKEYHPLVQRLLTGDAPPPATATALAARLDQVWDEVTANFREGSAQADEVEIVNWMTQNGLLTVSDPYLEEGRRLAGQVRVPDFAVTMSQGTPENAQVSIRGSHRNLGQEVPNRFLTALGGRTGSRLDLAHEITGADNPLTARVIVNRLWHHLFGRGIVATVDDFGPQGQAPTHPQLLDWLATDFVKHGWSLKHTLRLIVLSQTYGQDSVAHPHLDPDKIAIADPTNILLHRMPIRRLQAEAIRDAILAVSGHLDNQQFGPSVATHRTPFMTGRGARKSGPLDGEGRRSIYLSIYRNFLSPFLQVFDMPNPFGPKGRRSVSNVPAQALALMNDPFVLQQAGVWATNTLRDPNLTEQERITAMVERSHGVPPTSQQLQAFSAFLEQQAAEYGDLDERAWTDLAHALFNMKAFYFLR